MYDVAIIGGGIVGSAIARELMRYDVRAVLIDKYPEVGFGVTKANSGIIHAGHHSDDGTVKAQYEWAGNQKWDCLVAELGFGFRRIGEFTLAFDEESVATLYELKEQGERRGVPGLELWDYERIVEVEPNISPDVIKGLYAPTAAVINPYEACYALAGNAVRNGLKLSLDNEVFDIAKTNRGFDILTAKGTIRARIIVNAAGLFADEIARMAGDDCIRISPRKGEEYILDKRLQGHVNHLLFPCPTPTSKGILVIPTYDGTIMVGPTAHPIDDKDDHTTSGAGAEEVFSSVRQVVPTISARDCIAQFAGLRAVSHTNDFIIGPAATVEGLIHVAGIQSPGLTAAPAIAEDVVGMIQNKLGCIPAKETFHPTYSGPIRFAVLPKEEQMKVIAKERSHGSIVCRCEHVTEGEIVSAIRDGAETVDGIKFRTRAGMGRCQGGFCMWRTMELIAEHRGVPLTEVTKRGDDSWLVCEYGEGH